MKAFYSSLLVLILLLLPFHSASGQGGDVAILSPVDGEGVKGQVLVTGYIKATGYTRYDLEFAFTGKEDAGWLPIASAERPAEEGFLGTWDTTSISDGNYSLRLRVYFSGGEISEHIVSGVRVRNYSTMETATPNPAAPQTSLTEQATKVSLLPTGAPAKPAAPNPAALTQAGLQRLIFISLGIGIILAVGLALIFNKRNPGS